MTKVEYPLAIICVFTWIGFVCAISFLEAWLKFRAPGVTLAIGLGIGRLVFNALNKVEWVFALVIAITALLSNAPVISWQNGLFRYRVSRFNCSNYMAITRPGCKS